ncbi:hypothetical protein PTKIN_Ptkin08bG0007600 [Pterospermum kingtungense]
MLRPRFKIEWVVDRFRPRRIPLWIQIRGLPLEYQHPNSVARIAQRAGHVTDIDWNDSIPHNPKFVRVKISIDLDVPLIAGVMLRIDDGEMMWVDIIYEKIHKACRRYGILRHPSPHCLQMIPELEPIINEQMEEINKGSGFKVGCNI